MKTVRDLEDILKNINTLESYNRSTNLEEVDYHSDLVKRGTCFIATMFGEEIVFSPSRFIGYLDNSIEKHDANKTKDGRVTNPEIEKILNSKFRVNEGLERAYQRYCYLLGFTPRAKGSFGVTRKYIALDIPVINPDDFLVEDLQDIERQSKISDTEKVQLVSARLGQGQFRDALFKYWEGCCCTGCKEPTMLRASHIKPWRLCDNKERLDSFNGLLLIPNLDLAFDNGLISFSDTGDILISDALADKDRERLGITPDISVRLTKNHRAYMKHHRVNTFRK